MAAGSFLQADKVVPHRRPHPGRIVYTARLSRREPGTCEVEAGNGRVELRARLPCRLQHPDIAREVFHAVGYQRRTKRRDAGPPERLEHGRRLLRLQQGIREIHTRESINVNVDETGRHVRAARLLRSDYIHGADDSIADLQPCQPNDGNIGFESHENIIGPECPIMFPMAVSTLDWIILIAYLVLTTIIGLLLGWRIRSTEHYFFGERSFGKWIMIGQTFGVGTHAEMPVAVAGAVYTTGMSAMWFQWKNLFATPFYWLMAPLFRRVRRMTTAEVVDDRYGPGITAIYNVFAVVYFTINMAGMLKGAGKVISEAVGGALPVNQIVIGMTVAFMLYSFVGGLIASAWTNLFQGVLIIVLSFLLVPLGWPVVGGLDGMKATLENFRFSLATPEGIGPWIILMLTLNGVIGIIAMPHIPASVGTGKNERTCRVGFFYGSLLKRFCTIGWALVGLIVAAMIAQGKFGAALSDPEQAFGFAARHLLFPGGIGLLVAGILAANMSTCSAFMVDSGALFTQGFYRKHIAPGRSDRHYLWAGRAGGLLITLLGVWYALALIDKVLYSFLLTETMATYMGISIFGGIVWRRANRWGALASLAAAMGTNFVLYYLRGERLDHWDANVFFVSLLAGILALVIVSLLSRPEPEPRLESFFARLETPSDQDKSLAVAVDRIESSPQAGPENAAAGRQLVLANLFHLRRGAYGQGLLRAYRDDLAGFGTGILVCVIMVLATALFLRL